MTYDVGHIKVKKKKNCPGKEKKSSKRINPRERKEKKENSTHILKRVCDQDHGKSCPDCVESGKSRENKPFHQHRVKYNDYEAQIKYPHNAALACWCIKLQQWPKPPAWLRAKLGRPARFDA